MRAYINGESNYSKGEKDATLSLISYLHSHNESDWIEFNKHIQIPSGDSVARVTLLNNGSSDVAERGFLQGQNHPEDIENMIWLFNTFRDLPLMSRPIAIWKEGDSLIYEKIIIANKIRKAVLEGAVDDYKNEFLIRLKNNSIALTKKEIQFSESLGSVARKIRGYLFYVNTIFVLLILSCVSLYVMYMIRRLKERNTELTVANKELDMIAYNISHDLRAPINSMMGLVNLAQLETDPNRLKDNLEMIQKALLKQERFIKEMIAVSKESRQVLKREIVELDYLIDQVINQHKHMSAAREIKFLKRVGVHRVFTDPHRLEIILNNLVSNAIKYHDHAKKNKIIEINTYSIHDKVIIDVADNGSGIEEKDKPKIFEMYYMSAGREKGSGLGLYLVKEALAKLDGEIKVKSKIGEGSTFSVILKK